eukprot:2801270-Karenia_brevis.AAC.1
MKRTTGRALTSEPANEGTAPMRVDSSERRSGTGNASSSGEQAKCNGDADRTPAAGTTTAPPR